MSLYDILGTHPEATADELKRAYQVRAKLLHPDNHAGASPDVLQAATDAMAELNEAWDLLRDPEFRRLYDQVLNGDGDPQGAGSPGASPGPPPARDAAQASSVPRTDPPLVSRPPNNSECTICGNYPARSITLRSETGKILWRVRRRLDGTYCRDCGTALFRSMTNRTMLLGWWGVISFFVNWFTIVQNLFARLSLSGMQRPQGRHADVEARLDRPLSQGRPLLLRSGPLATIAVLVVVILMLTNSGSTDSPSYDQPADPQPEDFVGSCLELGAQDRITGIVDCDGQEDAKVTQVVPNGVKCDSRADAWYEGKDDTLCVELR